MWDLPQEIEPMPEPVETYSGKFELVVELPPFYHIDFHRSEAQPVSVLDDNIIALVETDEKLMMIMTTRNNIILTTKRKKSSLRVRVMTRMKTLTLITTQILQRMISYAKALITLLWFL